MELVHSGKKDLHTTRTQKCLYCGNNPISHAGSRLGSTLSLALTPLPQVFLSLPGGRLVLTFSEFILDCLLDLLVVATVLRFNDDPEVAPSDRGKVLCIEAVSRGWKMETAHIFGRTIDVYRLTMPARTPMIFSGLPRSASADDALGSWIDDKAQMKQHLADAGVPVSKGGCFNKLSDAEAYFKEQTVPVIVKPRFGSRGRHTTTYITSLEDFRESFQTAKQLGKFVVVEEHLIGSVYRATMIDGKLVGVLAGDPPRVTGDGVHTLNELIVTKNDTRNPRVSAYRITPATHTFLQRFGYTLDSVLESGKTIDLIEKIGLSYGGCSREVTPLTHPKLRAELERAAEAVNDPIIGFDFITPDVSADPDTMNWGIIECNALPFINLHHDPLEGEPVNVAGILFDYIERNARTR